MKCAALSGAPLGMALLLMALSGCDRSPTAVSAVAPGGAATAAKTADPVVSTAVRDISFDTLKFDIEKDQKFEPEMITPEIKNLDGQRVRLRGYMLPSFLESGLTRFILVRDNMECCFGPGAALYDCTVVEMAEGKTANYSIYPIAVEGKFTIIAQKDSEGVVRSVFHIQADSAK